MRTDGWQTGITKLTVAFGNFAKMPTNSLFLRHCQCHKWIEYGTLVEW